MEEKRDEIVISWTAPEFIRQEKTIVWFIVLGLVSAGFLVVALLMKNYIFALIIILSASLIFIQALRYPKKLTCQITEEGIFVNQLFFRFEEFKSFWIFEEPEIRLLSLLSRKITRPVIHLPLGEQKPSSLRQALKTFIPEIKQEEPFVDFLARKIKF